MLPISKSRVVWPRTHDCVEAYTANDNHTAYYAVSNMRFNFFSTNSSQNGASVITAFDVTKSGIGNWIITVIDIKTENIKCVYPTEFLTWVTPLLME